MIIASLTEKFFSDKRYSIISDEILVHEDIVRMKVIYLWKLCCELRTSELSGKEIRGVFMEEEDDNCPLEVLKKVGLIHQVRPFVYEVEGMAEKLALREARSKHGKLGGRGHKKQNKAQAFQHKAQALNQKKAPTLNAEPPHDRLLASTSPTSENSECLSFPHCTTELRSVKGNSFTHSLSFSSLSSNIYKYKGDFVDYALQKYPQKSLIEREFEAWVDHLSKYNRKPSLEYFMNWLKKSFALQNGEGEQHGI